MFWVHTSYMETELTTTLRKIIREEVQKIVHSETGNQLGNLKKQYCRVEEQLDSINESLEGLTGRIDGVENRFDELETQIDLLKVSTRDELRTFELVQEGNFKTFEFKMNEGFKKVGLNHKNHNDKLDIILEAWNIQKLHRRQLDNHELRITTIEHRIPAIS